MKAAAATGSDVEIPDIDCIAGMPHPRETPVLFGHAEAEAELRESWQAHRLHHAWLLSGNEGIGKATLAYRFARFLLANPFPEAEGRAISLEVSADAPAFRQVASQAHPDLLVLRRPWQRTNKRHAQAITVDEARRLRGFLGQTAAGSGWRVVIVDSADDLNIGAANALLKSLEEPPVRCIFLLVAAMPGRLPVTIRSRCRMLRMEQLGFEDLRKACETAIAASAQSAPDAAEWEEVLALAQGSPGTALRLVARDGAKLYRQLADLMAQLPALNYGTVHALADSLAPAAAHEQYELFQALLSSMIARLISHAASGEGALAGETELAERLVAGPALARWVGLWETLQREKAEADALNLDRKMLLLETFFRLERVSRGESV
jgi:DNA polymerase III subunit delta'